MTRLKCLRPRLAPAPVNGWKPDAIRGSRHDRGYGNPWDKLRAQIKARDLGLCQECLRNGRTTVGTDCDHIVPKSQGGSDDPSNLEMKCRACHDAKSRRESQGRA